MHVGCAWLRISDYFSISLGRLALEETHGSDEIHFAQAFYYKTQCIVTVKTAKKTIQVISCACHVSPIRKKAVIITEHEFRLYSNHAIHRVPE